MTKEEKLLSFIMLSIEEEYTDDIVDIINLNSELTTWWADFKKKEKKRKNGDKVKFNRIAKAQEDVRNWANT